MEKINGYEDTLRVIKDALEDKLGTDIKILNIGNISSLADYFVIATGNNKRQIVTMAEEVEKKMKEGGEFEQLNAEGMKTGDWSLLDFGQIIVHIFDSETRKFYDLERTWGDAEIVTL